MPGQGRAVERAYSSEERATLGDTVATLGETTFDIHLNDNAFWRNIPATVWHYKLGGATRSTKSGFPIVNTTFSDER